MLFSCTEKKIVTTKKKPMLDAVREPAFSTKYSFSILAEKLKKHHCQDTIIDSTKTTTLAAEARSHELAMQAVEQKNIALYNALIESYRAGESYGLGLMLADMMIYKYRHPKAYYDRAVLQYEGSRKYGTEKKLTQDILYNLKKAKQNGYKWHKIFELPDKQKVSYSDIN